MSVTLYVTNHFWHHYLYFRVLRYAGTGNLMAGTAFFGCSAIGPHRGLLLDLLELILAYAAQRAYPIVGNILESRSRSDTSFGIANCRIIDPIANRTSVLHNPIFVKVIIAPPPCGMTHNTKLIQLSSQAIVFSVCVGIFATGSRISRHACAPPIPDPKSP